MELLLIKGTFNVEKNVKSFIYGCYGTSLCLILVTSIIYMLNLDQLSSTRNYINNPRKKPSVILYAVLTFLQVLKQIFIIISVHYSPFLSSNLICVGLQVLMIYFSMIYSALLVALQIRAYRSVKYALKMRAKRKISWRYFFVVIIPSIITLVMIIESFYHQNKWSIDMFNRIYVKCLLLLFSGATVLVSFLAAVGIILARISNLLKMKMGIREIVQRMKQAIRLRNILVLCIINIVIFSINTQYASTEEGSFYVNFVVADSITHLLLVGFLFPLSIM